MVKTFYEQVISARGAVPSAAAGGSWRRLGVMLPLILLASCAVTPPVQEMSDARQAISAAREAQASRLAPGTLQRAEQSLDEAARGMEQGDYVDAREAAKLARRQAIRARDEALSVAPGGQ